jgi:N-acetylglucosamine-6-sulfatase
MIGCLGQSAARAVSTDGASVDGGSVTYSKPNVGFILTDDQLEGTVRPQVMPNVYRELVQHGTRFTNSFVSNTWCCPSRATAFTGQYSGHNGVWTTGGRWGLKVWHGRHQERNSLPVWMHQGGYRTGIFGKYMNQFGTSAAYTYSPPGWDVTAIESDLVYETNGGFYDYDLYEDGRIVHYGSAPTDYSTRVLTQKARSFIASSGSRPWFAYVAYNSPHGPGTPDPLDTAAGAGVTYRSPNNVCEADVSDKPAYVRSQPACSISARSYNQKMRSQQSRLLASVDRGVGRIIDDLKSSGELRNTIIVYSSDNGHEMYNHRLRTKEVPYEESLRVPLMVRWDALNAPSGNRSRMVVNTDLAPTITDAANVMPGRTYDGRSLIPLMHDAFRRWRSDFLIEHSSTGQASDSVPSYCGVRRQNYKYVEYASGKSELYVLSTDPGELVNRAGDPALAAVKRHLRRRTGVLCDPLPPIW